LKKIVLLGGGHAHMVTLANLERFVEKGCEVSVVQPGPRHYYSGMGPGMLSRMYTPSEISFATRDIVEKNNCSFLLDKAEYIDPDSKIVRLQSGQELEYDVLSCNVGSFVPDKIVAPDSEDIFPVKPIAKLLEARERIQELAGKKPCFFAVVGGGPAALEIAANLRRLVHDHGNYTAKISIFAGEGLMSDFSAGLRRKAYLQMRKLGIKVVEQGYVQKVNTGKIVLEDDSTWEPDLSLLALGVRPSSLFQDSSLPTGPDGGLLVNKYLQSVKYPEIFGGGDCIYFQPSPLDKVGVYAVRQNPVLLNNIMASVRKDGLQSFDPGGKYMLIFNTGDGKGIFVRGNLVLSGKWAFKLKDRIDRKFMRRFKSLE